MTYTLRSKESSNAERIHDIARRDLEGGARALRVGVAIVARDGLRRRAGLRRVLRTVALNARRLAGLASGGRRLAARRGGSLSLGTTLASTSHCELLHEYCISDTAHWHSRLMRSILLKRDSLDCDKLFLMLCSGTRRLRGCQADCVWTSGRVC